MIDGVWIISFYGMLFSCNKWDFPLKLQLTLHWLIAKLTRMSPVITDEVIKRKHSAVCSSCNVFLFVSIAFDYLHMCIQYSWSSTDKAIIQTHSLALGSMKWRILSLTNPANGRTRTEAGVTILFYVFWYVYARGAFADDTIHRRWQRKRILSGNILKKKIEIHGKNFSQCYFFHYKPCRYLLGSNTGLRGDRWTVKRLRHVVKCECNRLHGTEFWNMTYSAGQKFIAFVETPGLLSG